VRRRSTKRRASTMLPLIEVAILTGVSVLATPSRKYVSSVAGDVASAMFIVGFLELVGFGIYVLVGSSPNISVNRLSGRLVSTGA
jgi:hypothetical protein